MNTGVKSSRLLVNNTVDFTTLIERGTAWLKLPDVQNDVVLRGESLNRELDIPLFKVALIVRLATALRVHDGLVKHDDLLAFAIVDTKHFVTARSEL